ncbi:MAG: dTDP-4-dehydrorhamnose reductase [Eubacteriales bacterium]
MKFLVTGYHGQLGYDVIQQLNSSNYSCFGASREDFDITDEFETKQFIRNYKPDAVIHCAAYTSVDKAEVEKALCYRVNVLGTRHIAQICKDINIKLLYISTDYVFNGMGEEPFKPADTPHPINYYGLTKYKGELEVLKYCDKAFIIRVSWLFGINGNNFVKTMLRLAKEKKVIHVVCDQIGSPSYTQDVAKLISDMISTDKYGVYHAVNQGYCSWYEFAREIFDLTNTPSSVNPIKAKEYPTIAIRPYNSRLSTEKLKMAGFTRLPHWRNALVRYLKEVHQ